MRANSELEFASSILTVIAAVIVPSIKKSSTPVTVTVCGVFQFPLVKVKVDVTEDSVLSTGEILNTTSEVG